MIIGLTGGIGSGKSTIAKIFKDIGIPVYDSDKEAKVLMNNSPIIKKAVINLLGEDAYIENILNRSYVTDKVFKDKTLLSKLNTIVHPEVKKHFSKWAQEQKTAYVIQETALIFENNSQANYDKVILVTAPVEQRIKRVINRDAINKEAVLNRIANQLSDDKKIKKADYVIENIDIEKTKEIVRKIHQKLLL